MWILFTTEYLRALRFKSPKVFLKRPPGPITVVSNICTHGWWNDEQGWEVEVVLWIFASNIILRKLHIISSHILYKSHITYAKHLTIIYRDWVAIEEICTKWPQWYTNFKSESFYNGRCVIWIDHALINVQLQMLYTGGVRWLVLRSWPKWVWTVINQETTRPTLERR